MENNYFGLAFVGFVEFCNKRYLHRMILTISSCNCYFHIISDVTKVISKSYFIVLDLSNCFIYIYILANV